MFIKHQNLMYNMKSLINLEFISKHYDKLAIHDKLSIHDTSC